MSLVSVIIPCFDNEKWIEAAVKSCLLQDYLLEIIIVDDFSNSNCFELLKEIEAKHPQIVRVFKNRHKGGNNARTYGFEKSSGKYIQWLDGDDTLLPGKLKTQVNSLEHTAADIAYSSGFLFTYASSGLLVRRETLKAKAYNDYLLELLKDNWLPPHSYLLRREVASKLHNAEAWNPKTKVGQDREYFTRAAISGAQFVFVPGTFIVYNRRLIEQSVSRKWKSHERATLILELLQSFKREISGSKHLQPSAKAVYLKVIDTQIIHNCSLYKLSIGMSNSSFSDVRWSMIKGFRSKLKLMYYLLTKNR